MVLYDKTWEKERGNQQQQETRGDGKRGSQTRGKEGGGSARGRR